MASETVVAALANRGYRLITTPIRVGDIAVAFDAALVGPEREHHLILIEVAPEKAAPIARRLRALLATLEHIASTRPVSLVLVAEREPSYIGELQRLCPVYWYRPGDDAASALKALFPLELPTANAGSRSADAVLKRRLGVLAENATAKSLIEAAVQSPAKVHDALRSALGHAAAIEKAR